MTDFEEYSGELDGERLPDLTAQAARQEIASFFDENRTGVFSSRQIEVRFEQKYFHWITHRVLADLADSGFLSIERTTLKGDVPLNVFWHKSNRYTRRPLRELLELIQRYSDPDFTAALGNTGELLVSDGFSRFGFLQRGRETRAFAGRQWQKTEHNLDFIFERDGRVYGVEVKNTLPYINDRELRLKMELCAYIGVLPLFVVRAMPQTWIMEVARAGGFTLVLRHHLYPLSHKALAREIRDKLGLPVDAPRALYDGTMQRFERWHNRKCGN